MAAPRHDPAQGRHAGHHHRQHGRTEVLRDVPPGNGRTAGTVGIVVGDHVLRGRRQRPLHHPAQHQQHGQRRNRGMVEADDDADDRAGRPRQREELAQADLVAQCTHVELGQTIRHRQARQQHGNVILGPAVGDHDGLGHQLEVVAHQIGADIAQKGDDEDHLLPFQESRKLFRRRLVPGFHGFCLVWRNLIRFS